MSKGRTNTGRNIRETDTSFTLLSPMRWFTVVLIGLIAASALAGAVFTPFSARTVLLVIIAAAFAYGSWRAASASIRCDATGVTGIDFGESRKHLSWSEFREFEWNGFRGISARKVDGSLVTMMFYATLGDLSPEKAVALLNQQRQRFAPDLAPDNDQSAGQESPLPEQSGK